MSSATITWGKYVSVETYDPRHDPTYPDRVVVDLLSHWGEWRRLHETVGGDCWSVRDAVEILRRLGFEVVGDRELGYCVVGFSRVRYLRVEKASIWPAQDEQLTLLTSEENES